MSFIFKDDIILIYVDNALYFYKDKLAISKLREKIINEGMLFREEDSVAGYLGLHIDQRKYNSTHLKH